MNTLQICCATLTMEINKVPGFYIWSCTARPMPLFLLDTIFNICVTSFRLSDYSLGSLEVLHSEFRLRHFVVYKLDFHLAVIEFFKSLSTFNSQNLSSGEVESFDLSSTRIPHWADLARHFVCPEWIALS